MLKSITISNFFSFAKGTKVELNGRINLLLGINGSGKTSFINALRLLTDGIAGDGMAYLIQERWGGFDQIVNLNGESGSDFSRIVFQFDHAALNELHPGVNFKNDIFYQLTIQKSGTSYILAEKIFTDGNHDDAKFLYLNFTNGNGRISAKIDNCISFQQLSSHEVSGQESVIRQINDPVHYLPVYVVRKAIQSFAVYNDFNVSEGSRLRMPAEYSSEKRLKKNGENLSNILNYLKLEYTFDFEHIEKALRNVNPNFKSLDINNLYGQSYLSLRERNMRKAIGAMHISDGTLRFLLLESIFFNPERGKLIGVDEPERGLHPDMICSVAEMIKKASRSSQIIIATHSPYLLNQFTLEDIIVFSKTEDNFTEVRKFSDADFPETDEALLPGEMWLLGQIGGKRW